MCIRDRLINALVSTGELKEIEEYDVDFDHQFLETEKYDAKPTCLVDAVVRQIHATFSENGLKMRSFLEPSAGTVSYTHLSTGEHLHITCKLNGRSISPSLILDYIQSIRQECISALAGL